MGRSGKPPRDPDGGGGDDEEAKGGYVARSAYEVQRLKLEKLMKDPTKPVFLPESKRKERDPNRAPDFVYNVMGSSAGAGSGEFHVYRQIRRKEYDRQKVLEERKVRDDLNEAYHLKLQENEKADEERTAKKRAKRLKKKRTKRQKPSEKSGDKSSSSSSESEQDSKDLKD